MPSLEDFDYGFSYSQLAFNNNPKKFTLFSGEN